MPILNAAPPPPVKTTVAKTAQRAAVSSPSKARTDALTGLGQLAQVPLVAFRQYADAATLGAHWPNVAREVAALADKQPQVARLIDPLIQIGPYTGLITAVLPMVMQLAVNHGVAQPGAMGTVPPATLSAQMEAAIATQQLEAMRMQLQAEKAAAAMRQEISEAHAEMQKAMQDA